MRVTSLSLVSYRGNDLDFFGQSLQLTDNLPAIEAWKRAVAIEPTYTPALWRLTRALAKTNAVESRRCDPQLKSLMVKAHDLDEEELRANNAIAAIQAHDWLEALKGMREAIKTFAKLDKTHSQRNANIRIRWL